MQEVKIRLPGSKSYHPIALLREALEEKGMIRLATE
jgi:hypothetical protein